MTNTPRTPYPTLWDKCVGSLMMPWFARIWLYINFNVIRGIKNAFLLGVWLGCLVLVPIEIIRPLYTTPCEYHTTWRRPGYSRLFFPYCCIVVCITCGFFYIPWLVTCIQCVPGSIIAGGSLHYLLCYLSLLLITEMFSIRLSEAKENRMIFFLRPSFSPVGVRGLGAKLTETTTVLTEHVQKCERHQKVGSPVEHSDNGECPACDTSWKDFT